MASMHFWGVEVKGKEPTSVKLEEGQVIHISQATLGELKKDKEPVIVHLKVGDKKLVMGVLNQNTPQLSFDLVIDQDFEISHNWKNGSVHFLGYDSDMPEDEYSDFSEDDEDIIPDAVPVKENGKPGAPAAVKAPAEKGKKDNKVKPEPKVEKDVEDDSDDDDEDDSEDDDDDSDAALEKFGDSDEDDDEDSSDEDDDDSDEGEETPKPDSPKKRSKAVLKTPEAKKAKLATPQKTDGKKGGGAHTATPHPSKKPGKSGEKPSPKSNKSGAKVSCGSCGKTFNNEVGLQSHTKAKHAK